MHNPRAEADDVLLIVAREEGHMVGYLGVLPDRIFNEKDEAFKCGWLSCMWVDPEVRGKGIAKKLIGTAFDSWGDHILVTEFTSGAKGLYDRSGHFTDLRTSDGLRCYLRFNLHEVLPKKNERYNKLSPLLALSDAIANVPVDIRLKMLSLRQSLNLRFEKIEKLDEELISFISANSRDSFEGRAATELSWIKDYPWLSTNAEEESKKYHFSVHASRFENLFIKLTDDKQIHGFVHLTIRDNHLRIPYAYLPDALVSDALAYICHLMIRCRLNMLTVLHPSFVTYLRANKSPFIYKRPIQRKYIITKTLDVHFTDHISLQIQDGDADCAFT